MTIKEKLQKIQDVSYRIEQLLADMRSLSAKALNYLNASESGDITITETQKENIITKYQTIKTNIQIKFQELP